MAALLHLLTKPDDAFAQAIIAAQESQPDNRVDAVDLTQPQPDYAALVGKIFSADSVAVW